MNVHCLSPSQWPCHSSRAEGGHHKHLTTEDGQPALDSESLMVRSRFPRQFLSITGALLRDKVDGAQQARDEALGRGICCSQTETCPSTGASDLLAWGATLGGLLSHCFLPGTLQRPILCPQQPGKGKGESGSL